MAQVIISTLNTETLLYTAEEISELNNRYKKLNPLQRVEELYKDFTISDVMLTSSFAATSAMLLKLFSQVNAKQKVYFIDTGYHFDETLVYKDFLKANYGLKVTDLKASEAKHALTTDNEMWKTDPNRCCTINKVEPIEEVQKDYKVWVSGLMHWQSDHRATLDIFEERNGILKFYPLLDVDKKDRDTFIKEQNLPAHPLLAKGYGSIGCKHCTKPGADRNGRWNNSPKTECGLHL